MKLTLFGQFRIEGGAEPIRLSAARRLIALLCLRPGTTWDRARIASHVWPATDGPGARERLRTTLASARRALGDNVSWEGGRNSLRLVPADFQVDLWEAQAEWRRAGLAPDASAEFEALSRLSDLTSGVLLPEMPEFLSHEREEWCRRTVEALLRLATIEQERENLESAARFLERSLSLSPYDERAWTGLIRVQARLGQHVEVCDRFARARQQLRNALGSDFSSSLRQLAQQARRGDHSASSLSAEQIEMIARTISRQIESAPLRAAEFLGSEEFRLEVFQSPVKAADLLERVLACTTGGAPARMQCAVYAMMAHTLSGSDARILALGQEVANFDSDPTRLRAAETMRAGAYLNRGQYVPALVSYERALTHAIAVGNMPGIDLVMAQRAVIEWELGKATETLAVLTEIEHRLGQYDEHNARVGRATLNGYIGLVHLYDGDTEAAKKCLERCTALALDAGHPSAADLMMPALGLSQILLGNFVDGVDQLRKGLARIHRLKSDRRTLLAIDYCAFGLVHLGRAEEAMALLNQSDHLRRRANIPNSPIHQSYGDQLRASCGEAQPIPILEEEQSVRELVAKALAMLS